MTNYDQLCLKLESFIKKYYTNQLIKGGILFVGVGLLYAILSLVLEYFLWLGTLGRSILFWSFILVILGLLIKFIIVPLSKLFNLTKGIGFVEASRIIGDHFHEVDDKLLNLLQLDKQHRESDLLLASIDQKSKELEPVPFGLAISFRRNLTYVKYALIPIFIFLAIWFSGNASIFSESYDRVINYDKAYVPPAPFEFFVTNDSLKTYENTSYTIEVSIAGDYIPQEVKIEFDGQEYYLKQKSPNTFSYTFGNVTKDLSFNLSANEVQSRPYTLQVLEVPTVLDFKMNLDYPAYTRQKDEILTSAGSATVPEGTEIDWKINTKSTGNIVFVSDTTRRNFLRDGTTFSYERRAKRNFNYEVVTSNKDIAEYERLAYQIRVIKDQAPSISIEAKTDSTDTQATFIRGQVSDDYGLRRVRAVYYAQENEDEKAYSTIPIGNGTVAQFIYVFPGDLVLTKGVAYEYYFEVFDNDAINGSKSTRSRSFSFRKNTDDEEQQQRLIEQQNAIQELDKNLKNKETFQKELEQINKEQKEKTSLNYSDKEKLKDFLKRQQQAEQLMKNYTKELKENLSEFKKEETQDQKNRELQERLERNEEKLEENEKLLEELQKYQDKIDKEELNKKLEELSKRNKNQKRNLEQLLELTKQYYVEQKAENISEDLQKLANKQEELAKKKQEKNTSQEQQKLNEEFEEIQKELNSLQKENDQLKKPLDLERDKTKEESVKQDQKEAKSELEKREQEGGEPDEQGGDNEEQSPTDNQNNDSLQKATKKQQSAAKKMKEMSQQMAMNMQSGAAEGESEDAEMLRQILDNLVVFSVEQEELMDAFKQINIGNPSFSKKLRTQYVLKENFLHVDDSLYALALRNPKITEQITEKLTDVSFDLDKSLERLAENQLNLGTASQQYVVTGANDLAYMLSKALDDMQAGAGSGSGQGKGKGQGFQLSDIIEKQEELGERAKSAQGKSGEKGEEQRQNGNKGKQGENENGTGKEGRGKKEDSNGDKEGEAGEGNSEETNSAELYEIYKQQQQLRNELEERLRQQGLEGQAQNLLNRMQNIENELVNKGITAKSIQQIDALKHHLLKLEQAAYEQGEKEERKSTTNRENYINRLEQLQRAKEYFKVIEILDREALPLRPDFKEKVQTYFKVTYD